MNETTPSSIWKARRRTRTWMASRRRSHPARAARCTWGRPGVMANRTAGPSALLITWLVTPGRPRPHRGRIARADVAWDLGGAPAQPGVRLRGPRLSDRQREVTSLIAAGMSNRAIASRLGLGRRTVDTLCAAHPAEARAPLPGSDRYLHGHPEPPVIPASALLAPQGVGAALFVDLERAVPDRTRALVALDDHPSALPPEARPGSARRLVPRAFAQ